MVNSTLILRAQFFSFNPRYVNKSKQTKTQTKRTYEKEFSENDAQMKI